MNRTYLPVHLVLALTITLLIGCANPGTPEGGPKDTSSPVVRSCEPLNFSTGFTENSFRINVDEFVTLINPNAEITLSPPFKVQPEFRLKGKSIMVRLEDTLAPNTTYRINFGNSIVDITENNPLKNFTYVFSTGTYIDSLSLGGQVISAFDNTPQKEVCALLYLDNIDTISFDSLPFKVKPYYMCRTDEEGRFRFDNLISAPMRLIALKDQNSNIIFDQASEFIGFHDSLVVPVFIPAPAHDSTNRADTIQPARPDTVLPGNTLLPVYTVRLFEQTDSVQRVVKTSVPTTGLLQIILRFPSCSPRLNLLMPDSLRPAFLMEVKQHKDTLNFWFPGETPDTLVAALADHDTIIDTLDIVMKKAVKKKKSETKEPDRLQISLSARGGFLNHFTSNLELESSFPLRSCDYSGFLLISDKDTIHPGGIMQDSLHRRILIPYKWQEGKSYTLIIPDSSLYGLNDKTNDSLRQNIKTVLQKDFGSLILDISALPGNAIIQVMNEKETVLMERYVTGEGKVRFDYIKPGKYKIKIIYDRNGNHKWDTGNLFRKLQPEEIFYFPKTTEIRGNWEVEESWIVKPVK